MGQKVLLSEEEGRGVLRCLQMCKNKEAIDLVKTIADKLKSTPQMDMLRKEGIESYQKEGEIEIDEGAVVSLDDSPGAEIEGAYVMGWIWVSLPDPPDPPDASEQPATWPPQDSPA